MRVLLLENAHVPRAPWPGAPWQPASPSVCMGSSRFGTGHAHQGGGIPLGKDLVPFLGVIETAGLVLLQETNGVDPAQGRNKGLKSLATQLDGIEKICAHGRAS